MIAIRQLAWRLWQAVAVIAIVLLLHGTASAQPTLRAEGNLKGSHWARYRITATKHTTTLYIVGDGTQKPVVFLSQGSGCMPLFTVRTDGTYDGTSISEKVVASHRDRFHFAVVEKRGVLPLHFNRGMSREDQASAFEEAQTNCSDIYERNATKTARVEDVATAIEAIRLQIVAKIVMKSNAGF